MDLLDAHGAAVLAMLRRLCRRRHDADDVFQETAAAMDVREGTVKSRLNAGLGQLRSVLEGSQ